MSTSICAFAIQETFVRPWRLSSSSCLTQLRTLIRDYTSLRAILAWSQLRIAHITHDNDPEVAHHMAFCFISWLLYLWRMI
jgi:hypothetical protein